MIPENFHKRLRRLELYLGLEPVNGELPLTLELIANLICSHFRISREQLKERNRHAVLAYPRHWFCWLALRQGFDAWEIGRWLGRERSNVLHSRQRINELINGQKKDEAISFILLNCLNGHSPESASEYTQPSAAKTPP